MNIAQELKEDLNRLSKLTQAAMNCSDSGTKSKPPFGGLRPVLTPRVAEVYSKNCYICNDADYARWGLPLCYPCPCCGGHVPADDSVCDDCGKWIFGYIPCPSCGAVMITSDTKCSDCGTSL